MASPTPVNLDSDSARDLIVACIERRGSMGQAAALVGVTKRTLQRYCATHTEFGDRLRAIRDAETPHEAEIDAVIAHPPAKPAPKPATRAIVIAEVVTTPIPEPDVDPGPISIPVPGSADYNLDNLRIFYARTARDRSEPAMVRTACIRAMHDDLIGQPRNVDRLREINNIGQPTPAPGRDPNRQPGLRAPTVDIMTDIICGPKPVSRAQPSPKRDDPPGDEAVIVQD